MNLLPPNPFPNVTIGRYTYGHAKFHNLDGPHKITIGNFCSLAEGTTFLLHSEHEMDRFSTYPFHALEPGIGLEDNSFAKGDIIVGHDVWFGINVIVTSGVVIGTGAVIASGAVVTKSVPPYAVVGGVPAKVIKFRFDGDRVCNLLESRWWEKPLEDIIKDRLTEDHARRKI